MHELVSHTAPDPAAQSGTAGRAQHDRINLVIPRVTDDLYPGYAEGHRPPANKAFFPSFWDHPGQHRFRTPRRVTRLVRGQRRHVRLGRLLEDVQQVQFGVETLRQGTGIAHGRVTRLVELD